MKYLLDTSRFINRSSHFMLVVSTALKCFKIFGINIIKPNKF